MNGLIHMYQYNLVMTTLQPLFQAIYFLHIINNLTMYPCKKCTIFKHYIHIISLAFYGYTYVRTGACIFGSQEILFLVNLASKGQTLNLTRPDHKPFLVAKIHEDTLRK